MNPPIHQIPLHICIKSIHLLQPQPTPLHNQPLQRLQHLKHVIPEDEPQPLQPRILGPRIQRPVEQLLLDVHEARFAHPLGVLVHDLHVVPERREAREEVLLPELEVRAAHGTVVAGGGELDVLELDVPAGGEGAETFGEEVLRAREAGYEGPAVDEVEGLAVDPGFFVEIFDFEVAVGWDAGGEKERLLGRVFL